MPRRRLVRLNEQIKREISELLLVEVRDPRVGSPTVTSVEVTEDLWLARVYVRPGLGVADDTEAQDVMLEGLAKAAPFIRRALGKALKIRRVPELRFLPDRTLEDALRINRILREVAPRDRDESDPLLAGPQTSRPESASEPDEQ
jgi:ribosome-binding factor A